MKFFSGYDQIIVNSRFTHDWYIRATQKGVGMLMKTDAPFPTLTIVHPPVQPFELKVPGGSSNNADGKVTFATAAKSKEKHKAAKQSKQINIAICGRFFRGRQSKGHDYALSLLVKLKPLVSKPIHLNMVGFVHPDQESFDYVEELRTNATNFGVSVSFLINAEGHEIATALSKSTIYWHLTGVNLLSNPGTDPASFEHFGIAIVEAMYCGCIPIVTSLGGVTDIVTHNYNGLLAKTEEEFLTHTMTLLSSPQDEISRLRRNALKSATKFSVPAFMSSLQSVVSRGVRGQILRNITAYREADVTNLLVQATMSRTKLTAVIIEASFSTNFKLCVRNVMHQLGIGWRIHVYYSPATSNDQYMKGLLRNVRAQFIALTAPILTKEDYDRFLKGKSFWERYSKDEKLLFFRPDTVFLRKGIQEFWNYDFISAPLLYDVKHSQRTVSLGEFTYSDTVYDYKALYDRGVGQGAGVSLRTAGAMLQVLRTFPNETLSDESEGSFFARNARRLGYKVADNITSYKFAWEAEFPELGTLEKPPVALRGAWLHMRVDLITGLIARNALPSEELSISKFPATKGEIQKLLLKTPAVMAAEFAETPFAAGEEGEDSEQGTEEGADSSSTSAGEANGTKEEKQESESESEGEEETANVKSSSPTAKAPGTGAKSASSFPLLNGKTAESSRFWKFIHTPELLLGGNVAPMTKLLDDLGVVSMEDLKECDDSHIEQIKLLVKPVQRNKLIAILQ